MFAFCEKSVNFWESHGVNLNIILVSDDLETFEIVGYDAISWHETPRVYLNQAKVLVLVAKEFSKEYPGEKFDATKTDFLSQFILDRLSLSTNSPHGVHELVLKTKNKEKYNKLPNGKVGHEMERLRPDNYIPYKLPSKDEMRERDTLKSMENQNQKRLESHTKHLVETGIKGFKVAEIGSQALPVLSTGMSGLIDKKINSVMYNDEKTISTIHMQPEKHYNPRVTQLWHRAYGKIHWILLLAKMHKRCSIYQWYVPIQPVVEPAHLTPEQIEEVEREQREGTTTTESNDTVTTTSPHLSRHSTAASRHALSRMPTAASHTTFIENDHLPKGKTPIFQRRTTTKSFTDEYVNYTAHMPDLSSLYNPEKAALAKAAAHAASLKIIDDAAYYENYALFKYKIVQRAIDDIHIHENTIEIPTPEFKSYNDKLRELQERMNENKPYVQKVVGLLDKMKHLEDSPVETPTVIGSSSPKVEKSPLKRSFTVGSTGSTKLTPIEMNRNLMSSDVPKATMATPSYSSHFKYSSPSCLTPLAYSGSTSGTSTPNHHSASYHMSSPAVSGQQNLGDVLHMISPVVYHKTGNLSSLGGYSSVSGSPYVSERIVFNSDSAASGEGSQEMQRKLTTVADRLHLILSETSQPNSLFVGDVVAANVSRVNSEDVEGNVHIDQHSLRPKSHSTHSGLLPSIYKKHGAAPPTHNNNTATTAHNAADHGNHSGHIHGLKVVKKVGTSQLKEIDQLEQRELSMHLNSSTKAGGGGGHFRAVSDLKHQQNSPDRIARGVAIAH